MILRLKVLCATYRTLDQSGARDSHGFNGLKHIDHLLYFQTFQNWVQRTERSTATKTVTEKWKQKINTFTLESIDSEIMP